MYFFQQVNVTQIFDMTENECCPESFQHKIQDVPNTKFHSNMHYLVESEWTGIESGIFHKQKRNV